MARRILLAVMMFAVASSSPAPAQLKKAAEVKKHIDTLKASKDIKERLAALEGLVEAAQVKALFIKPAEGTLIVVLGDKEAQVQLTALEALSYLEPYGQDRVPALIKLVKESPSNDVKIKAMEMIGKVQDGAFDAVAAIDEVGQRAAMERDRQANLASAAEAAKQGIRNSRVDSKAKVLQTGSTPKAKADAARELAKMAGEDRDLLQRAAPIVIAALNEEDAEVRGAALVALGAIAPEGAWAHAAKIARNDKEDKAVRLVSIDVLGRFGQGAKEALPFLESTLARENKKPDKDADLVKKLEQAVKQIKAPTVDEADGN